MVLTLELKGPGAQHWQEVAVDAAEPVLRVDQLAPGTKYSFRSRIGASWVHTDRENRRSLRA